MPFCAKCGFETGENDRFCESCGAGLENETQPPDASTVARPQDVRQPPAEREYKGVGIRLVAQLVDALVLSVRHAGWNSPEKGR